MLPPTTGNEAGLVDACHFDPRDARLGLKQSPHPALATQGLPSPLAEVRMLDFHGLAEPVTLQVAFVGLLQRTQSAREQRLPEKLGQFLCMTCARRPRRPRQRKGAPPPPGGRVFLPPPPALSGNGSRQAQGEARGQGRGQRHGCRGAPADSNDWRRQGREQRPQWRGELRGEVPLRQAHGDVQDVLRLLGQGRVVVGHGRRPGGHRRAAPKRRLCRVGRPPDNTADAGHEVGGARLPQGRQVGDRGPRQRQEGGVRGGQVF
mmetsp:Transcript_167816/g.533596  ORF Transcript_167816/g.533596 Transcript_167816/m.533596 type:complete len:262 (+) Transcript_167816:864-1649(+)